MKTPVTKMDLLSHSFQEIRLVGIADDPKYFAVAGLKYEIKKKGQPVDEMEFLFLPPEKGIVGSAVASVNTTWRKLTGEHLRSMSIRHDGNLYMVWTDA